MLNTCCFTIITNSNRNNNNKLLHFLVHLEAQTEHPSKNHDSQVCQNPVVLPSLPTATETTATTYCLHFLEHIKTQKEHPNRNNDTCKGNPLVGFLRFLCCLSNNSWPEQENHLEALLFMTCKYICYPRYNKQEWQFWRAVTRHWLYAHQSKWTKGQKYPLWCKNTLVKWRWSIFLL